MVEQRQDKTKWIPFLRQMFVVTGIACYMTGTGANIAFPGVLLQQLREPDSAIKLTTEHESWIASVLGLALMTGIAASPIFLERLGRKMTNQLSTLPSLTGWALLMIAKTPEMLLISRFLQGLGMGLQASAAPVSIAEYSSPVHRGAFLATIALSFSTGMLIAHLFGTLLYWRTASLACGCCYAFSLLIITVSPETPSWLAAHGYFEKCKKSFIWLRGNDKKSVDELNRLIKSQREKRKLDVINDGQSRIKFFLGVIRKKEFYKPTLIMVFMFTMFQVSGMTVIPSYTVPIMKVVTGDKIDGYTAMLVVDLVRFITAVLSTVIVNRFKRRSVLFFGSILTVLSLLLTSLLIYLRNLNYFPDEYNWVPVIPMLIYMFGKTIGILAIPWAVAGEIFPLAYRSIGSGISGMVLSLLLFVVVKTAPKLFLVIGVDGTFCCYAVAVAICAGFLFFLLPETKGKTLQEIELYFKGEKVETEKLENGKMMTDDEEHVFQE